MNRSAASARTSSRYTAATSRTSAIARSAKGIASARMKLPKLSEFDRNTILMLIAALFTGAALFGAVMLSIGQLFCV